MSAALSLWHDTGADDTPRRSPLAGDLTVDVAIVGGGYTGLWAAYYLTELAPDLRIVVLERHAVGFGASGRNGGWCIGEVASGADALAKRGGREAAVAQLRALFAAVDEVGAVAAREGIDADYHKGGTVRLARNRAQLARLRAEVEHHEAFGLGADDQRMLDADEAAARVGATSVLGGLWFAHTAVVHPYKLVRGLARAVEARGVTIHEDTTVTEIRPGTVATEHGTVSAPVVVRATEGYTRDLVGERRTLAPLYSLMVATEPLPDASWDEIGLADRETFSDDRHLVIYGQRTADGRLAFGGRGAPYGFGSAIDPTIEQRSGTHDLVIATLRELFPVLADTEFTHRWGGVLGVPRDWFPSVAFDRASGLAVSGGYVGEGVAAANLGGRTLAELIVGADTDRTRLPWVGHRSRRWEPEPFRWLGINGALAVMKSADAVEARSGRPARRADLLWRLLR